MSVLSLEYIPAAVTPRGTNDQDPSNGSAWMAVVPEGSTPLTGDWKVATWDHDVWPPQLAILVGPGGVVAPAVGQYEVWVKFGTGAEVPVLAAGNLEVY